MRRWAALIVFGGCSFASVDPEALLAAHAGPGADACGALDLVTPTALIAARDCALDAHAARRAWWVSVDQGVADGRLLTGFADDGAHVIELDYAATYSMGIGGDDEDVHVLDCRALGDRGLRCGTVGHDLCLLCGAPTPR